MNVRITCIVCKGTGSENNPPAFFGEGEAPELNISCEFCNGGSVEVDDPAGIRTAYLVAKEIVEKYPNSGDVDSIYQAIVTNISNATNFDSIDFFIEDGDLLFSDEKLPIDKRLEKTISRFNMIEEAKLILGIEEVGP